MSNYIDLNGDLYQDLDATKIINLSTGNILLKLAPAASPVSGNPIGLLLALTYTV